MRRPAPLLLTLALLSTGGCSAGNSLYDFDGDGSLDENDCGPADPAIYPGAPDTFGDGIDQDCDGSDGVDLDGDGYASLLSGGTDCVDTDPLLNPTDADQDGFSTCSALVDCDDSDPALTPEDSDGDHYSSCTGDCDDGNSQINPEQEEVCDLLDNDCDGVQADDEVDVDLDGDPACNDCDDNNELLDHLDLDGDSFSLCDGDCIDDPAQPGSELIYPAATDLVDDDIDNNCDGIPGTDADGDQHASLTSGGDDCDDTEATTHPAMADSVGDGIDNNCDGIDGVDADGDLHASEPSGGDDCDDTAPGTYPGAPDSLDTLGLDTDCDLCDPTLPQVWNHVDSTLEMIRGDGVDSDCDGYAQNGAGFDRDCDDSDGAAYPGSTEVWESPAALLDTNCDGGLYTILSTADYSFVGENSGDWAGRSVSSAGDVDGDGRGDLLVGAPDNDDGGTAAGKAYLILGSSLGASPTIDLSSADYSFVGGNSFDHAGRSVSSAGDVDGDGLSDLLVGAPYNNDGGSDAGKAYLILGSSLGPSSTINLSMADYSFVGENSGDTAGRSVSSAGDVDGDGLSDLLLGASNNDDGGSNAGKIYLILGSSLGASSTIDLALADYSFVGENSGDTAGFSVSSAGDVDGDGLSDLLLGASNNDDGGDRAGKAYLILGSSLGSSPTIDLSSADYSFVGENAIDRAGLRVFSAGDVDGDGLSDLLVGAYGNDDGGDQAGKTYLILGRSLGSTPVIDLSVADYSFVGEDSGDIAGYSVSSAGDVDGDGLSDLLLGAHGNDDGGTGAGKTYLVLGSSLGASPTIDLSMADYSFGAENSGDSAGSSVSSAGDVDGDGLSDLLVGAPYNADGGSSAGKAYLLISPFAAPDYAGLWTLGSTTTYSCLSGVVTAQLDHLNITHRPTYVAIDPTLIANAYELTMDPRSPQPGLLHGGFVSSATPDSFALTRTESLASGACTASWSLTGAYTGPDTLSADFTATFTGSCGDCTNQSFPVTATR